MIVFCLRTFCIMGQLLFFLSKLKLIKWKQSESKFEVSKIKNDEFKKKDPKPSDLCMSKLKSVVIDYKGLNPRLWQKAGMTCA
jgi:hypothetical protein